MGKRLILIERPQWEKALAPLGQSARDCKPWPHANPVIPGRRASVEPGIHFAAEHMAEWIPGPR